MGEVDAMCDLLLEEDLPTSYVTPGPNLPTLPDFITHPRSMVGSDALLIGDYPSPAPTERSQQYSPSTYVPKAALFSKRRYER